MQYIQLQPQLPNDIPSANSGTMNLFINNTDVTLKDENGDLYVSNGASSQFEMDLSWSNEFTRLTDLGETVSKLIVNVNTQEFLDLGYETWLIIERYRKQRTVKDVDLNRFRVKSGWKHDVYPSVDNPDRPSEILLTGTTNIIDLGLEHYFTTNLPSTYTVKPRGKSKKYGKSANVYLRFKLKYGTEELGYTTTPVLKYVKLIYNNDYEKGMSTTTDKVFGRYRQDIPWFAVYSFGGSRTGGVPIDYGVRENEKKCVVL